MAVHQLSIYSISLCFLVRLRPLNLLHVLGRLPIPVIDDAYHAVVTGAVSVSQFSGQHYSDLSSSGLINFTPNHPRVLVKDVVNAIRREVPER
jgi:hypothetical protein